MTSQAITRVLLVDDHALIVEAMRIMVERIEGVKVVATAGNGREALARAREHHPDLVIMDISMQEMNGIDAAARLLEELPTTRVLILSSHTTENYVQRAIRAGVWGYLAKESMPGELINAVTAIRKGEKYLSPVVAGHVMTGLAASTVSAERGPLEGLTPRQREILQLLVEGRSTKEIAFALDLSVKTVETHRTAIMDRLQIHDLAGLVLFAVRHGLIEVDRPDSQ